METWRGISRESPRLEIGHKSNRLNMIHKIPAMKKEMPRNGGTTLRMRRYNPLNTAMVPLGNSGVTPPPQNLTAVDIDAKISFYGKSAVIVVA